MANNVLTIRSHNGIALIGLALLWIFLILINPKIRNEHPFICAGMCLFWIASIAFGIKRFFKDYIRVTNDLIDVGGRIEPLLGLTGIKKGIASITLIYGNRNIDINLGYVFSGSLDELERTLLYRISAQQVDSAEASTIAVPPSMPSGSPR